MNTTVAVTTVRAAADNPRAIEGIAVPYGQVATATEIGAEAFAPGAFSGSVAKWMSRADGARMAFRPAHGERPIGTVTALAETPDGVAFRAEMFNSPEADRYLSEVGAGLNGVSIEFSPGKASRRGKDGITLHREASLYAIAGATLPAYDGARVSLRDMEVDVDETTAPVEQREQPAGNTTEIAPAERARKELETVPAPIIQVTRNETVYGRSSGFSFLQDLKNASFDSAAAERQHRHKSMLADISAKMERAGDLLQSEIPGILETDFLPGLATPAVAQDTPMSTFFNTYAISDPRPRTFGKVTTSTAVSTTAKTEGAAPTVTDMATTAVTVTPAVYAAQIDVSREVIDAADPIAERLLIQDLTNRFNETVEAKVLAAVEAGASASGTAITAATPFAGMLGNVNKYYATRYVQAQAQFVPSALYAVALSQLDSAGRPILPFTAPYNANGTVMAGGAGAFINGARVFLSPASTTNVVVTAAATDYVIYRSPMLTFRFSEVVGPQSVRIAVFGYLGIGTRLGSLKVTAA